MVISTQSLSVGNVVTAAFRLYRSHLKQYIGISFRAILWALIPIYGWAKLHSLNALISRLAFGELVNQPESLNNARNEIKPRLWNFFVAQFLVGLIAYPLNIIHSVLVNIFASILSDQTGLLSFVSIGLFLLYLFAYLWLYSRLFIPELPLAIEGNMSAGDAISRSWKLTKSYEFKIMAIVTVAGLITLPLIGLASIPLIAALLIIPNLIINASSVSPNIGLFFGLIFFSILLFLIVGVFTNPFWQAVKAVIYYDLRTQKEGLGLTLRDGNI